MENPEENKTKKAISTSSCSGNKKGPGKIQTSNDNFSKEKKILKKKIRFLKSIEIASAELKCFDFSGYCCLFSNKKICILRKKSIVWKY